MPQRSVCVCSQLTASLRLQHASEGGALPPRTANRSSNRRGSGSGEPDGHLKVDQVISQVWLSQVC